MAWAGSLNALGPFTFRGCDLRGEYLPAKEEVRVQLPAAAPAFARRVSAGKGCRAVALAKAGLTDPTRAGYGSASHSFTG